MAGLPSFKILATVGSALFLASCTVGPDYVRPDAPTPPDFKELKGWRQARPRDGADRGVWWSVYRDAELSRLVSLVEVNNQNVAAALAAYEQARAVIRESQSSLLPTVSGTYPVTRSGAGSQASSSSGSLTSSTVNRAYARTVFYPQGTVSWTIDVWGKIRREIESNVAGAQADPATSRTRRFRRRPSSPSPISTCATRIR